MSAARSLKDQCYTGYNAHESVLKNSLSRTKLMVYKFGYQSFNDLHFSHTTYVILTHICINTRTNTLPRTHACTHTHTRTQKCTHTHTHTHAYQWQFLSRDEGEGDTTADPSWIEDEGQPMFVLQAVE